MRCVRRESVRVCLSSESTTGTEISSHGRIVQRQSMMTTVMMADAAAIAARGGWRAVCL